MNDKQLAWLEKNKDKFQGCIGEVKVQTSCESTQPSKLIVIAGTYRQFDYFCRQYQLTPKQVIYPNSIKDVSGLPENTRIAYTGTWTQRRGSWQFDELLTYVNNHYKMSGMSEA